MNVETGEIKEFESEDKLQMAMASGKWVELDKRPNQGCNHCHGRGHIGFNTTTQEYVICRCVKKRPVKENRPSGHVLSVEGNLQDNARSSIQ